MTNRFVSFLEAVGHDFKTTVTKLEPEINAVAQAAAAGISVVDPALGPILQSTMATVMNVEKDFAAIGQQTGTGPQKLAAATTILEPLVAQAFSAAGKPSDVTTVQKYISGVVTFLNGIPASSAPVTSPAAA